MVQMEKQASAEPVQPVQPVSWKLWVKTARPFSLSASVSPILVGTAVAGYQHVFAPLLFALTLFSSIFLQVGVNYFNEYFDHRYGLDTEKSLGASTVIFQGTVTARQVLAGGIGSFVLAAIFGLALIVLVGPQILLFGLGAMTIGYFYSARPFKLAARGLGDPMVFLAMGFLMVWGAYYVQTRAWSWSAFAASIPIGFLVVAILNMNNLRDYPDDRAVNKRTVVVRFGQPFGRWYQTALVVGAYVVTTVAAVAGLLSLAALVVWITFPLAWPILSTALAATERRAFVMGMKQISLLHLVFGVVLAASILVATFV